MSKKKLINFFLIIILVVVIVISFFITDSPDKTTLSEDPDVISDNLEKESASITDTEKKSLIDIDINTYLEYYQQSENKIIFIGRPTCPYCQLAQPIIQKISKDYDLDIYYLNTDKFQNDDESNFVSSNDFLVNGYGTPLLFIISNNEIVDYVDGATDTAHYIQFFKNNNYIK